MHNSIIVTEVGTLTSYLLVPDKASVDHPAPAIVTSHGYLNDREMQDIHYVERSRGGYVAFAMNASQHGDSSRPEKRFADTINVDPIWQAAGELKLPITIHIADPVAFFDPLDETNERWEELGEHPDWAFPSPPFPPFLDIVNSFANVVARHPQTTFIGAHVGCYAENLQWVSELLERCPNFYVDISARIAELGCQPYTARRFFIQYADRILFGTDMGPDVDTYRIYCRAHFANMTSFNHYALALSPIGCSAPWAV